MIPRTAFIALSLLCAVSAAFGYFIRGIVDQARKEHLEGITDGSEADHDRWEDDPEPTGRMGGG